MCKEITKCSPQYGARAANPMDKLVRENGARRPINGRHRSFSHLVSSGVFVRDAVHMNLNVHAGAHISVPNRHEHMYDHRRVQNMRELTYHIPSGM